MKCPFCGNEIEDGSRFCKYCGKRQDTGIDDQKSAGPDKEKNPDVNTPDDVEEPLELENILHKYGLNEDSLNSEKKKADKSPSDGDDDSGSPDMANHTMTDEEARIIAAGIIRDAQKKKYKSFGARVKAVVYVLLFVALMFIMQSCVTSAYTTSLLTSEGSYTAGLLENAPGSDEWVEITNSVTEAVADKTVMILLVANLLTLLTVCLIFHLRHKNPLEQMSFYSTNPYRYLTFALFGVSLNIFVSVTLTFISLPAEILESFETHYAPLYSSGTPAGLAVEIFSTAVVAGIVEEIIFRGIAMKKLLPSFGNTGSVIISALIFGLAHGTPVAIAYATLLGLILGSVYAIYRSIYPCIFIHIFFNFTSYLLEGVTPEILVVLYLASAALIIHCSYRIYVRRPTWADICFDYHDRLRPINDREKQIKERLHQVQRGENTITIGEMDNLHREWEKNREAYNRYKRQKKSAVKPKKK